MLHRNGLVQAMSPFGRDRGTARATLGKGLADLAFPLSVSVQPSGKYWHDRQTKNPGATVTYGTAAGGPTVANVTGELGVFLLGLAMLRITKDPAVADVATGAQSSSILDHLIDVIMRPHRYEVREEAGELFVRPASEPQTKPSLTGVDVSANATPLERDHVRLVESRRSPRVDRLLRRSA
jgi:hypothetical protein